MWEVMYGEQRFEVFVEFPLFSVSRMLLQINELKARSPELSVEVALGPF